MYFFNEMVLVVNFHYGLHDKIAKGMTVAHIMTLDKVVPITKQVEDNLQRQPSLRKTTTTTLTPAISTSSTVKCFSCQGVKHKAS